ncbi:MAG: BatD family protein [Campylobacterales bacterium]|nr:BatD family protein [Campylobacterales bacterium]
MKRSLGSLLALVLSLYAEVRFEVACDRREVVVGEPTWVRYSAYFDDEAFTTTLALSLDSDAQIIDYGTHDSVIDGKRESHFEYLVVPKSAGAQEIKGEATLRTTTRGQIENAVIGRDNVQGYQFTTRTQALPSLALVVGANDAVMLGDLKLSVVLSGAQIKAYEPLHVTITLEGNGSLERFAAFTPRIEGVELFSEAPQHDWRLCHEGQCGKVVQKIALVAQKDFVLPSFELELFNTRTRSRETLKFDATPIGAEAPYAPQSLLDADAPRAWDLSWLNGLLGLVLGIALGWVARDRLMRRAQVRRAPQLPQEPKVLLVHFALEGCDAALLDQAERELWSRAKIVRTFQKEQR